MNDGDDSRKPDPEADALERFVEEMGLFYQSNGMPRIAGRIVSLLLASAEPLPAERIAEKLRVARSSVSTNLNLLLGRGAAEKVTFPGDRLTYYRFSWETWQRVVRAQMAAFEGVRRITMRATADLGKDHPSRARIEEFQNWVDYFVGWYGSVLDNWPDMKRPQR